MKEKIYLEKREFDGKVFYSFSEQIGAHGRTRPIWVAPNLVQWDDEENPHIEFPVVDAGLKISPKGTPTIVRQPGSTVYRVYVRSGYRGGASFRIKTPITNKSFRFGNYGSQLGNLGIDDGIIVATTSQKLVYRWHRSGRLYGGAPDGVTVLYPDGRVETIDDADALGLGAELDDAETTPGEVTIKMLLAFAEKLPTGLPDPVAVEKLAIEIGELEEAIADGAPLETALAEAADVAYYAAKTIDLVANLLGVTVDDVMRAAYVKYQMRATDGNPKDTAKENAAIARMLNTKE